MEIADDSAPIGQRLKPILNLIENALWDYECKNECVPDFDDEAFRSIIKLFMAALIERVWKLQEKEDMSMDDRIAMGQAAAKDIHKLIKVYANLDTLELYKEILSPSVESNA
jgi:hypothetical protein